MKVVQIVGTGTIGEPLIGLLCDYKDELGIDEVTFHKNTPLLTDRYKVENLIKRGAIFYTSKDNKYHWCKIGKFHFQCCFVNYICFLYHNLVLFVILRYRIVITH